MSVRKSHRCHPGGAEGAQREAVFCTAYDYPTATFADRAGVD